MTQNIQLFTKDSRQSASAVLSLGLRNYYARGAWITRMQYLGWSFSALPNKKMMISIGGIPTDPKILLNGTDVKHESD